MIRAALLTLTALLCAAPAFAEDYQSSPPRVEAVQKDWGQWLGPYRAKVTGKMLEDFGEQYLYAPLDAALPPTAGGEKRVVFIGDSITDRWDLARFFPGKPYINRGIGGQVTPQMLVRFHADVIALNPAAVVILGGVNDVQGVFQVETEQEIEANYMAMAEIADANHVKLIFTAITPVNNYTDNAKSALRDRRPEILYRLNIWLKTFCGERHYGFIDYGPVLRDNAGLLRADYTTDGIHPNDAAYAAMAPVAQAIIDKIVGQQK